MKNVVVRTGMNVNNDKAKVPPSKPKWEILNIAISQNTKRSYDKPNDSRCVCEHTRFGLE